MIMVVYTQGHEMALAPLEFDFFIYFSKQNNRLIIFIFSG